MPPPRRRNEELDSDDDDDILNDGDLLDMLHYKLKPDHEHRPIFVAEDLRIFLETSSQFYFQAAEFLIAIAEPQRRPACVHEYLLTRDSLYAAASLGMTTEYILAVLKKFNKTDQIPDAVIEMVSISTQRYGKVTLSLKKGRYYLESSDAEALKTLMTDPVVTEARMIRDVAPEESAVVKQEAVKVEVEGVKVKEEVESMSAASSVAGSTAISKRTTDSAISSLLSYNPEDGSLPMLPDLGELDASHSDLSRMVFPIKSDSETVANIQRHMKTELDYPLLVEYAYENDTSVPTMDIQVKPSTRLRPYQEKSLKKMFNRGIARSGIIVLPCGAGKTLTGVTAVSTIKRRSIVLCSNNVAVEQWRREFMRWCDVGKQVRVITFTSDSKVIPDTNDCIVCATYSILAASRANNEETKRFRQWLFSLEWGMLVLDEVQTAPADTFKQLLVRIPAHCKLGLTATLVREDGRIKDLRFLVGPKLYEANWMDLQAAGYIAHVRCLEVRCKMHPTFFREYCRSADKGHEYKMKLCVSNPTKLTTCEFLIRMHEKRQDKIIVFADKKFVLHEVAYRLGKSDAVLDGDSTEAERLSVLDRYKKDKSFHTLFLSKIGDNAIDLPESNVLIQVSSHGGGRRQEAQRLGRILRAKTSTKTKPGEPNAFFYTLVSLDTREMFYATARQRFLVDQGYSFQVLSHLVGYEQERQRQPYVFENPKLHKRLLHIITNDEDEPTGRRKKGQTKVFRGAARGRSMQKRTAHGRDGGAPPAKKKPVLRLRKRASIFSRTQRR
eukprot:m.36681 g.36681  ORF g.36681 m.36681 type:complete len:781 (+) comp10028_c0_seq2:200-2542(+)